MSDAEEDWKEPHRKAIQNSMQFFSNQGKFRREVWVVRQLLVAIAVSFRDSELKPHDEPIDVSFRDARFQVKELMEDGRRRHDELRQDLSELEDAESYDSLLPTYSPKNITFGDVGNKAIKRAQFLETEKYGPDDVLSMDLLLYFNWLDYAVVPPLDISSFESSFRSISLVTNTFCAVLKASTRAPHFLQCKAGHVIHNQIQ